MNERGFGQAVKEIREHQKISQEELAFRADLHRTYISQIERGLKSPSLRTVQQIADAFQIDIIKLLQRAERRSK
jgi:transcriptional regulator with XRE-family HTH domain